MNLALADDGTCVILFGGYIGKFTEGFGGPCTYRMTGDIVSITAIGDDRATMQAVPAETPIQFRVEPSGNITTLGGSTRVLKRTNK